MHADHNLRRVRLSDQLEVHVDHRNRPCFLCRRGAGRRLKPEDDAPAKQTHPGSGQSAHCPPPAVRRPAAGPVKGSTWMFGGLQQLREGRTPPPPEPQLNPREVRGPQHGGENGAESEQCGAASQLLCQGDMQMQDGGGGYGPASPGGFRRSQRNGGAPLSQLTDPFRSQPSGSQQLHQPGASQRPWRILDDPLSPLSGAMPPQDRSTQDARTQPSPQRWPPQPHSQPDLHSQHSQQRRLQQLQEHSSGARARCDGRLAPLQQVYPLPLASAPDSHCAFSSCHLGSQRSATWKSQVSGSVPSQSRPSWEGAPHSAQGGSAPGSQQRPLQVVIGPSSSTDPASVLRGQTGSVIAAGQAQALGVFADDSDAEDFADFAVEGLDELQPPQQDAAPACRAEPHTPTTALVGGALCAEAHASTRQDSTLLQEDSNLLQVGNVRRCAPATAFHRDAGSGPLVGLQRPSWQLEGAGSPARHQHPRSPDRPLRQQQPGQQPQVLASLQQAQLPSQPSSLWQPQGCDAFSSQPTVVALLGTCTLSAVLNVITLKL